MEIKVKADKLLSVIEAIKQLPVRGDFESADRWVGCVIALQSILAEGMEETEVAENGE